MHLLSSILFAVSANIDAFIIGLSYGIRKSHIPLWETLIVSLITFVGTFLSIFMGSQLTAYIPVPVAQIFGCIILIILGIYYTAKSFIKKESCPEENAGVSMKKLSLKEVVFLGLALSINNMGMGIGASITGVHLLPTSLSTLVISFLFLWLGNHIGKNRFFCIMHRYADTASGVILIGLGIYELFI